MATCALAFWAACALAVGRANTGREGFWKMRTIHRVQVPGCLEDAFRFGIHWVTAS